MPAPPRDRLRELLDAVLGDDAAIGAGPRLGDLAASANSSTFHFARQVSAATGEPPVAMRRRVALERAAWQLRHGAPVTTVALSAGYDSTEGFARAFRRAYGCAPSAFVATGRRGHWLPAPNGVHFHAPDGLYLDTSAGPGAGAPADGAANVLALLVHHDLADVEQLLAAVASLSPDEQRRRRLPGHRLMAWGDPAESLTDVCRHLVLDKLPWLAAIEGGVHPDLGTVEIDELQRRHDEIAPRWLAMVRGIERDRRWSDQIVDALCEPPQSFVLGEIVAHVVTFAAQYRQLARQLLAAAGVTGITTGLLDPDPIMWHRHQLHGDPS